MRGSATGGPLGQLAAAEPLLIEGYEGLKDARPRDRITVNALRRLVAFYELRGSEPDADRYRELLAAISPPGS